MTVKYPDTIWWKHSPWLTLLEKLENFAIASIGRPPKEVKKQFKKLFTGKFDDGGSAKGKFVFDVKSRQLLLTISSKDVPEANGTVQVLME